MTHYIPQREIASLLNIATITKVEDLGAAKVAQGAGDEDDLGGRLGLTELILQVGEDDLDHLGSAEAGSLVVEVVALDAGVDTGTVDQVGDGQDGGSPDRLLVLERLGHLKELRGGGLDGHGQSHDDLGSLLVLDLLLDDLLLEEDDGGVGSSKSQGIDEELLGDLALLRLGEGSGDQLLVELLELLEVHGDEGLGDLVNLLGGLGAGKVRDLLDVTLDLADQVLDLLLDLADGHVLLGDASGEDQVGADGQVRVHGVVGGHDLAMLGHLGAEVVLHVLHAGLLRLDLLELDLTTGGVLGGVQGSADGLDVAENKGLVGSHMHGLGLGGEGNNDVLSLGPDALNNEVVAGLAADQVAGGGRARRVTLVLSIDGVVAELVLVNKAGVDEAGALGALVEVAGLGDDESIALL